jgi:hypothetical protein
MKITADRGDFLVFKTATQVKLYPETPLDPNIPYYEISIVHGLNKRDLKVSRAVSVATDKVPVRLTRKFRWNVTKIDGEALPGGLNSKPCFLDISEIGSATIEIRKPVEKELCVDVPDSLATAAPNAPINLTTSRLDNIGFEEDEEE